MALTTCPCGSQQDYNQCCGQYILGETTTPSPEALMRSRYTAYAQANIEYIQKTMKPPASDGFDAEKENISARNIKWQGLTIVKVKEEGDFGTVEFIARYTLGRNKAFLHERSEFRRDNGVWYYVTDKLKR